MTPFLIGIDLGTTNSALAYVDLTHDKAGREVIRPFAVSQLVAQGDVRGRELLPSFLYLPGEHDLPPGSSLLPWDAAPAYVVGEFARNHGAKVPGRLVTSTKSWLSHVGVDRSAPLLPWSAPPDVVRISPLEVSARYLKHLAAAWNHVMAKGDDAKRLEKQAIVLTVPASFDDVARTLTVQAARQAGFDNLTLLEEPQAAFYCWLATHSGDEASQLKPGDLCLVLDVGGGTSDFSLIQAVEESGSLGFVRQAVGDHLLLGGDNMDLALAKFVETKLPAAGKLDAAQYGLLTQACRQAKEVLLGPNPPASHSVSVMGRGRQVIGGALHATLTPAEVRSVILDGFFPQVERASEPQRGQRAGLHEMGLPYVSDPAITRHLAGFLNKQLTSLASIPRAILFNGGVFQPTSLQNRVVEVLRTWFDTPEQPWQPLVLTNPSLDLAVAWGATHFAWLKQTGGRRIGGGSARSYYVGVQSEADALTVVCVVPKRLEEGQEILLDKPQLELALGQPVSFPLYTSTVRGDDAPGEVLKVAPGKLLQLPPLHTILRGGKRSGVKTVPVTLAARCTEIGTLELYCVATEGSNRWRLEFNVRDVISQDEETEGTPPNEAITDVWPEQQVQAAAALIRATYSDGASAPSPRDLTRALEVALEASRERWPTGLCRRLWDFLAEVADKRRMSPAHLGRWYNLVGFCLRPGFGDSLDKFRVEQVWKVLHAPRPGAANRPGAKATMAPPEGGADFWIMWRRVAGGLSGSLQNALYNRLRPILTPAKGKSIARPGTNELSEMWRAVGSLERIDPKQKQALGDALLKVCRRSPVPPHAFWAFTRVGARVLFYGPLNAVVHPQVVQVWLDDLVAFTPASDSERLAWCFCLAQLARQSGQRALDIDELHRDAVLHKLREASAPAHWRRMVEEMATLDLAEQSQLFGESLPIGLRLVKSE